jgi:A/G-specific adenine glycosylase
VNHRISFSGEDVLDRKQARELTALCRGPLLRWFVRHRRDLPWRRRRTPYRVWVSELLLQQTRTDQALPYFYRFMKRYPTIRHLASASRQDVLKAWEGLGYYRRARYLHEAARIIVKQRNGQWPETAREWRRLPGVGPYTAAAIASVVFGEDVAVLDGNVERVAARLLAFRAPVRSTAARRALEDALNALLPKGRAGLFNEALMELGAICCTPRKPRCGECPLASACRALRAGEPERFPIKPSRKPRPHKAVGAGLIVRRDGRLLIARRKDSSMLGGLWEFPGGKREPGESMPDCIVRELREELGIETMIGPRFTVVRHEYSHFTIELHAHWGRIRRGRPRAIHCAGFRWVRLGDLRKYPFSAADLSIVTKLERDGLGEYRAWACGKPAPVKPSSFPVLSRPASRPPS